MKLCATRSNFVKRLLKLNIYGVFVLARERAFAAHNLSERHCGACLLRCDRGGAFGGNHDRGRIRISRSNGRHHAGIDHPQT